MSQSVPNCNVRVRVRVCIWVISWAKVTVFVYLLSKVREALHDLCCSHSSSSVLKLVQSWTYLCILYRLHSFKILCLFQSSDILLEIEFMKCELMVQSLGEKKENYSKAVVEVRSHKNLI